MEELDQPNAVALSDVAVNINREIGEQFRSEYKAELMGGVEVLHHQGRVLEAASSEQPLYMPTNAEPPKTRPGSLTFIPYYAWVNRQPSAMQVWTPYMRS